MSKRKKILITVICIIVAALVVLEIVASNYLVSFAIERKENLMEHAAEVVPEYETPTEDLEIIQDNMERMWAETQAWLEDAETEEWEMTSRDGLVLKASFFPSPEGTHDYLVGIHGYMSRRAGMWDNGHQFAKWGYNVLLPDLRACGESEGTYIGMGWLDRIDIIDWINMIIEKDPLAQIVVYGVSMGGATAMMVAGEESLPENVICAVEDCGYTSVWDIFEDELAYIFHLPAFPLLYTASLAAKVRAGYTFGEASSLEQIKKAKVPVIFLHGSLDTFVSPDMINPLYEACASEKEKLVIEGAGHGQACYRDPEGYFGAVAEFISRFK